MRLIFKTSSVSPDFFYVFSIILSFSTCSQSFKKICTREILGVNILNCIILVVKFFISKCKMEGRNPDFAGVQSYLKFHYNSEKFACDFSHQEKFLTRNQIKNYFVNKWM